jgi:hypothetical protein
MNIEFDIRKVSWAHFSQMQSTRFTELVQNGKNEDNIRLDHLPVLGISDLAEVNLGILLGFRSENGLRVRFKSPFENRELFVRISARLDEARRHRIPVAVGGAYRADGSFYAVNFQVGAWFYDLLKQTEKIHSKNLRTPLAKMQRIPLAELANQRLAQMAVRFSGKVASFSGLGSDYSYVLLGCIAADAASQIEIVFSGKNIDRDKFVDLNAALDWACEQQIPIEFGGDYNGEYFNAFYFKIKPGENNEPGELISLH